MVDFLKVIVRDKGNTLTCQRLALSAASLAAGPESLLPQSTEKPFVHQQNKTRLINFIYPVVAMQRDVVTLIETNKHSHS